MKLFGIKHRFNGNIIFSIEAKSFKLAIIAAIKQNADLRYADLRYADLSYADLSYADLSYANLDFSSWSLSCKTFDAKAGDRLVSQLFCHWARLDVSQCSGTIRYMHRFIVGMFGKSMANWFCKYRNDVEKI